MKSNLLLKIITPNGIFFDEPIIFANFFDINGQLTILKDYWPTIGSVEKGPLKIKNIENKEIEFFINSGLYVVTNNVLKIMTSFCIKNTIEEKTAINDMREKSLEILRKNNNIEISMEASLFKNLAQMKKK